MRAISSVLPFRSSVTDFNAETRFTVPHYLHAHSCVSGMSTIIAGRDGRAYGVLGVCTDRRRALHRAGFARFLAAVANLVAGAIQRRQLEQRHELMIRELRHRSGNLFSQLLALFSQTARRLAQHGRAYEQLSGARHGAWRTRTA